MALVDALRSGIKVASKILDSFKCSTQFYAAIGQTGSGAITYANPVTVRAIVDLSRRERKTSAGGLVMTDGVLTVLDRIEDTSPNTGFDRKQPVDTRDKFVLPDGTTGSQLLEGKSTLDAATARGFINELLLGSVTRGQ